MSTTKQPLETTPLRMLGFVKSAEMELSEAVFKVCDAELATAKSCLLNARIEIDFALEALVDLERLGPADAPAATSRSPRG